MKLLSKELPKSNLLQMLIKHRKQNYKTSECSVSYWREEELKGMYEYLKKEGIKHEMEGLTLKIYWR